MGVEFIKCTIFRDETKSATGVAGIDYDGDSPTSKVPIITDYYVKIKDYNGSSLMAGTGGMTFTVGTKAYGIYHSEDIKTGDKIELVDGRIFRIKSEPVKGLQYSVMDIVGV